MSIINTLRYISRSRRASAPRFFKEALVGVTGIYLLCHVVGLVDLWLHSSARSISVVRATPVNSEALYGITYDDSRCGPFNNTELPCQKLIYPYEGEISYAHEEQWMYLEGYDAAADINPYTRLESINNTSILVPGSAKNFKSQGFTFNTYGLRVECANLRDSCDRLSVPSIENLVPGATPVTNCSKAEYPRIPYYTSGELKESGLDTRNIESLVLGIIGDEMGGMLYVMHAQDLPIAHHISFLPVTVQPTFRRGGPPTQLLRSFNCGGPTSLLMEKLLLLALRTQMPWTYT